MSGFDWATFKDDQFGVNIDMTFRAFDETPLPRSSAGIMARFAQVEGISGSAHSDVLRGDDADAADDPDRRRARQRAHQHRADRRPAGSARPHRGRGPPGRPSTRSDSFSAGNIMLGGGGSDILEGRGGDDIIDGDAWLDVGIGVNQDGDGKH